jgi:hypothetical protein
VQQVVPFDVIHAYGAAVVTWLRDGHTCVLASRSASTSVLLSLAGSTPRALAA